MQQAYTTDPSLIRASDLIGLDIITQKVGQKINDVKDIIYDPVANRVVALVVKAGGMFSEAKILLFEQIKSIGHDAVIIDSEDSISASSNVSQTISNIAQSETYIDKTEVVTQDGNKLGKVTDLIFDKQTGDVKQLEVSGGMLDTATSGKKEIPIEHVITIGEDATVVASAAEGIVAQQAQSQGIKGAMNSAKDSASTQVQNIKNEAPGVMKKMQYKVQETGESLKTNAHAMKDDERTQDAVDQVKSGIAIAKDKIIHAFDSGKEAVQDTQRNSALGQYLTVNILAPNDSILANRGDMVTNELLQQAEQYGLLQKVVNNVSKAPLAEGADQTTKS